MRRKAKSIAEVCTTAPKPVRCRRVLDTKCPLSGVSKHLVTPISPACISAIIIFISRRIITTKINHKRRGRLTYSVLRPYELVLMAKRRHFVPGQHKTTNIGTNYFGIKKIGFAQLLIRKLRSFIRLWRVLLLRSDIRLTTSDIRYASFMANKISRKP